MRRVQVEVVDVPVTITGSVPVLISVCLSPNWEFVQLGYSQGCASQRFFDFPTTTHPSTMGSDAGPMSGTRPSFTTLYKAYLAAFNSHSLPETFAHLSPNIRITYLSNPIDSSAAALEKAYTDHWAVLKAPIVALAIEEFEEGVRCTLLDEGAGKVAKVVYWYAQEDGGNEWKHIKHEILEVQNVSDGGGAKENNGADEAVTLSG